ncbi:MAG: site-specific integrase [Pleurocapsa sp. SU_196_0]|nr:site-specific integrase [Pleurocapsa sp. SU_196_0]
MARRRSPGEGSVYPDGKTGRWRAVIVLGYDPETGNPQRKTSRHGTKAAAQTWLVEQRAKITRGEVNATKLTLADWLEQWLSHKERTLKSNSSQNYRFVLTNYVIDKGIAALKLTSVDPVSIRHWLHGLQDEGKSAYMLAKAHSYLGMALRDAVRLEIIHRNPAENERPASPPQPELARLPAADVFKLLETAAKLEHPLHCYVALALQTALRKEELLGLRWADVDLERMTVTVRQTVTFERGKAIFGPPKTTKARRTVEVDTHTAAMLAAHRSRGWAHRAKRLEKKRRWEEHDLVFPSRVGTPMPDKTVRKFWYDLVGKAGVLKVRLYDTRSTWGSEAARKRMNPKVIADRMGHTDARFTMKRYVRPDDLERREAALSIAELYAPEPPLKLVETTKADGESAA